MGKKTVAELLVDTLVSRDVSRIYGVARDSLNGLTDSIRRQDQLRWVHVRHEETAAFAAGAEAHLTGRLAVCAGSCGPGNLQPQPKALTVGRRPVSWRIERSTEGRLHRRQVERGQPGVEGAWLTVERREL